MTEYCVPAAAGESADSSSTSFFNSTVGAIAVLEYLIALIVEGSDKEVLDKLDADDKYTEEYRLK